MRTLVDTCVLSEARRPGGEPRVRERLERIDHRDFYLSVVTVGEIVNGISRLDAGKKRDELDAWIRAIEEHHADRIMPVDLRVARLWGELSADAKRRGVTIPAADGLIAATALRHDLAVMTRNTPHFQGIGVRLIDPWAEEL